jgi:hypothetical protein
MMSASLKRLALIFGLAFVLAGCGGGSNPNFSGPYPNYTLRQGASR